MHAWLDKNRNQVDRMKKSTAVGKLSGAGGSNVFGKAELENVGNTKAARSSAFGKYKATAPAPKTSKTQDISSCRQVSVPDGKHLRRSVLSGKQKFEKHNNQIGPLDFKGYRADTKLNVKEKKEGAQKRKIAYAFSSHAPTARKAPIVTKQDVEEVLDFLDDKNDDFTLKPMLVENKDEENIKREEDQQEEKPSSVAHTEATRSLEDDTAADDAEAIEVLSMPDNDVIHEKDGLKEINERSVHKHTDLSLFVSSKPRLRVTSGKTGRPHSFVKDPTIFARFPFGHSRSKQAQGSFENRVLKDFGVDVKALGVHPRRVKYCENVSVGTANGVTRIVFDRFGSLYAVAASNGTVRVHDFDVSEYNLQVRRVPEPGTDSDCLVCSVHTRRSVSDVAWSPLENEDKIVVAFQTVPELRIFDLNYLQAGSRPNVRVQCHAGNKAVLWVAAKDQDNDTGSMLIAGGSDGMIRGFQTRSAADVSFARKWEMRADPSKRSSKAATALVYLGGSNEGVLLSCTEGGVFALWDLNNVEGGPFGATASPQLLCESTTSDLGRSATDKSDYQVAGMQRLTFSSPTGEECENVVVRVAVTATSGSLYFVEVRFESAKKRAERCESRRREALTAREKSLNQSHLTSGGFSGKKYVKCCIMPCKAVKGFTARAKFYEPRLNVGLEVNLRGNIRQEVTEETEQGRIIMENNNFEVPACALLNMQGRLLAFSSFPHYDPGCDLREGKKPRHHLVGREITFQSSTPRRKDGNSTLCFRRTTDYSLTLPGNVVRAIPGEREVLVSHDLRDFLTDSALGRSLPGKCSSLQFDWSRQESINLLSSFKVSLPLRTSSHFDLAAVHSHTLHLMAPYHGPAVTNGHPRVLLRTMLAPRGNGGDIQGEKGHLHKDVELTSAPATALAAHPFLPYLVVGDKDDNIKIVSTVP